MVEYHGWINIDPVPPGSPQWHVEGESLSPGDEAALRAAVAEVAGYGLVELRELNYMWALHVAGAPNHRRTHVDDMVGLFRRIGELAPGSYGLLYVWDDEDPDHDNEFVVFKLVRGRLTTDRDPFLSPHFPLLEDDLNAPG